MPRFSVPTNDELFDEFNKKVPHGIKATFIRSLIRIGLKTSATTMYNIANNENNPDRFEIKEKT